MKYLKLFESENDDISYYDELIDSFLDDMKDISMYKFIKNKINNSILYSFCIRDYKSKKYEVDIFLKEIKSACKSIGFNVYINTEYYSDIKTGGVFDYIVLDFGKKKSGIDFRYTLDTLISQLGIRTLCKYY